MGSTPTFVLVHGSWHSPETWDKLSPLLQARGYRSVSVDLPSTDPDHNPGTANFLGDKEAVRAAILAETTQGRDVVVVPHSYGTLPGCSAVQGLTLPKDPSVSSSASAPAARQGHVIGIAALATGMIPSGVTFLGASGGVVPPQWKVNEERLAEIVVDPVDFFYHDLPEEEARLRVSKLRKQTFTAVSEGGEHVYAGWLDVPVWLLTCIEDQALPFEMQEAGVQFAREAGADITARRIQSSHSPMLSRPQETADFLLEAAADFEKRKAV